MSFQLSGIFLALASAAVWGSGDFAGGLASRRHDARQVLALAAIAGSILLLAAIPLTGEALPSEKDVLWAIAAGLAGAFGLVSLYRSLAAGTAAQVAPITGVIGAALPALYSGFTEGLLDRLPLLGLFLALAGIWLVVGGTPARGDLKPSQAGLAAVAGIGFAGFFILLAQLEGRSVFGSLLVARLTMLAAVVFSLRASKLRLPALGSNPLALLAGLFDASGNVLYLMAQLRTRLDIAAVLSSLYPVSTVLLAFLVLREPVSGRQWLGAAVCMGAIGLIAAG